MFSLQRYDILLLYSKYCVILIYCKYSFLDVCQLISKNFSKFMLKTLDNSTKCIYFAPKSKQSDTIHL